jgi:hypothetical protein
MSENKENTKKSTEVAVLQGYQQVVLKLNESVAIGLGAAKKEHFEKAFILAQATTELRNSLNDVNMKPIMELQGSKLGFKTDKDKDSGYPLLVVKNCLIEAVLTGVQPVGNQFNIIAGNCYITKEGFKYLLDHVEGLIWDIVAKLPRINADNSSAAVQMVINWSINGGQKQTRELDFPIKMNAYMGADAVIGKGTRKARKWLYESLTGLELADGDVQEGQVVFEKLNEEEIQKNKEKDLQIAIKEIKDAKDTKEDFDLIMRDWSEFHENTEFRQALAAKFVNVIAEMKKQKEEQTKKTTNPNPENKDGKMF